LRLAIAEFTEITQEMQHSVIKIKREKNKVADSHAKHARQATILASCVYFFFRETQLCKRSHTPCTPYLVARLYSRKGHLENQWGMFCPEMNIRYL
jgi:hypothetical protein